MEKTKLFSFISKYSLGGLIECAEWTLTKDQISTRFISDDDNAIGEIKLSGFENKNYKNDEVFGVANTGFLVKMMSVLGENVELTLKAKSGLVPDTLKISDGESEVDYMLADPVIIPKAPTPKNLPDPTYEFTFDKNDLIDKFIKAKAAFTDVETFTLNPKKKALEVIIGNTVNKIKIPIKSEIVGMPTRPIVFSSKYFREMLFANKEMESAMFSVYERGMAKIDFYHKDASVTYFLTEIIAQS